MLQAKVSQSGQYYGDHLGSRVTLGTFVGKGPLFAHLLDCNGGWVGGGEGTEGVFSSFLGGGRCLGSQLVLRGYAWLCAQKSFPAVLRVPYGIKRRSTACKTNALCTVLSPTLL